MQECRRSWNEPIAPVSIYPLVWSRPSIYQGFMAWIDTFLILNGPNKKITYFQVRVARGLWNATKLGMIRPMNFRKLNGKPCWRLKLHIVSFTTSRLSHRLDFYTWSINNFKKCVYSDEPFISVGPFHSYFTVSITAYMPSYFLKL